MENIKKWISLTEGDDEGDVDDKELEVEEIVYDDLFCVACNKAFRSEKQ